MLINGKKTDLISATDRGIQFGDGCFTTAAIYKGRIVLFSAHLERLRVACNRLNINFSNWLQLEKEMQQLAQNQYRAILKVIITRGTNIGFGYNPAYCIKPTRIVYILPWSYHYDHWFKQGVILTLSPIRLGRNPFLAGLKHLNRLEQVLIRNYLEQVSYDETLVLDSEGWITECCTANIFWRKDNTVYTPRLDQAGVDGIMRQFCLHILESSSFQVKEVHAYEKILTTSDEIILCNSLMPIVPVRKYGKLRFNSRKLFNFLAPFCKNPDL